MSVCCTPVKPRSAASQRIAITSPSRPRAVQRHQDLLPDDGAARRVYRVVDIYMRLAREWLDSQPLQGFDLMGNRLECRATTRKGKPCQRVPLPHQRLLPVAPASRRARGGARRRVAPDRQVTSAASPPPTSRFGATDR